MNVSVIKNKQREEENSLLLLGYLYTQISVADTTKSNMGLNT